MALISTPLWLIIEIEWKMFQGTQRVSITILSLSFIPQLREINVDRNEDDTSRVIESRDFRGCTMGLNSEAISHILAQRSPIYFLRGSLMARLISANVF